MVARVTFVFPRTRYVSGDPPLGLAYLAAVVRRERPAVPVRIVDGTFLGGDHALNAALRFERGELVGVYADSLSIPVARRVARSARAQGAFALAGGPAATVSPHSFLPDFDAVVRGEGEDAIVQIFDRIREGAPINDVANLVLPSEDGGIVETERTSAPIALDALPFPAWDLLDMARYVRLWPYLDVTRQPERGTNVVGSRGCPWSCTYCQPTLSSLFGKRVRRRSAASIAEEIEVLQDTYGIGGVFFHDDTITADRKWLEQLCEALANLKRPIRWGCNSRVDVLTPQAVDLMVDAGMRSVHLGIEAGSVRVRNEVLGKPIDEDHLVHVLARLRRRGAHALGFFMLGSPTETVEEMLQTIRLARRLPLSEATFSLTTALPGTSLHERLTHDAHYALQPDASLDYYNRRNFADGTMVGNRSLRVLQWLALAGFYTQRERLSYVLGHLGGADSARKLLMKVGRFLPTGFSDR